MKIIISWIPILLFTSNIAICQNIVGTMTTVSGEDITLYSNVHNKKGTAYGNVLEQDVNLTAQYLYYYDQNGASQKLSQAEIKALDHGNKHYKLLPIFSMGMQRLHEIIYENDEYMLTNYYQKMNYFYVLRKSDLNPMVKKVRHSWTEREDLKSLNNIITQYFTSCPELLTLVEGNIEKADYTREWSNGALVIKNHLFAGITSYNCE